MQVLRNPTANNSVDIFRQSVKEEGLEILERSTNLDAKAIVDAVTLVTQCKGKLLTSGVGKNWSVAEKIAATFASTGTVAFVLNPLNAGHGDFGNVSRGDVGIFFSKSGCTREILQMIPIFKSRGASIITIVGDLNSPVASQADVVLDASVSKETCPFNKAPTTSSTMAMVIGNALAVAVMKAKGITIEDFAGNHPNGRLGEILQSQILELLHNKHLTTTF